MSCCHDCRGWLYYWCVVYSVRLLSFALVCRSLLIRCFSRVVIVCRMCRLSIVLQFVSCVVNCSSCVFFVLYAMCPHVSEVVISIIVCIIIMCLYVSCFRVISLLFARYVVCALHYYCYVCISTMCLIFRSLCLTLVVRV